VSGAKTRSVFEQSTLQQLSIHKFLDLSVRLTGRRYQKNRLPTFPKSARFQKANM
jgi:hypothetical protein